MIEAKPGCCEVASPTWPMLCNQPATKRIFSPMGGATYRVCAGCADHSVRHRGMLEINQEE